MAIQKTLDVASTTKQTSLPTGSQLMLLDSTGKVLSRMEADKFMELVRESIKVGGRNLLKGTKDEWIPMSVSQSAGFSKLVSLDSLGLHAGDPVVLSMRIKPSAAGKGLKVRLEFFESDTVRKSYTSSDIATDENAVMFVRTIVPVGYSQLRYGLDANSTALTVTASTTEYYRAAKLERGNIKTDWTPAPEDLTENGGGVKPTSSTT